MVYDAIPYRYTRGMPSYITDVLFVLSILLYFVLFLTLFLIFWFYPVCLIDLCDNDVTNNLLC